MVLVDALTLEESKTREMVTSFGCAWSVNGQRFDSVEHSNANVERSTNNIPECQDLAGELSQHP